MELRSPLRVSPSKALWSASRVSPSKALWSASPARSNGNANCSIISIIPGWHGCHRITRLWHLRYLSNSSSTNALLKQSPNSSFRISSVKKGLGNLHLREMCSGTALAWPGLRQGRSNDRVVSPFICKVKLDSEQGADKGSQSGIGLEEGGGQLERIGQIGCWVMSVVYVIWLFVLPYAPGDPVWAISPATIQMLIDLSLNFFFVLPLASSATNAAGFDFLTAPVLHPTAEALFNFVIGWTLLFAPLLFTDRKRDRFGGSLETLWIIQMFLTNTVLAPYMAIRLNSLPVEPENAPLPLGANLDFLSKGMTKGAYGVGIAGAIIGLISIVWGFIGRPEGDFGALGERWEYFVKYVGSERLAYAFLWDIALYTFFQPWLIGDNLDNVRVETRETVQILRFFPYVGLVAYAIGLQIQDRPQGD